MKVLIPYQDQYGVVPYDYQVREVLQANLSNEEVSQVDISWEVDHEYQMGYCVLRIQDPSLRERVATILSAYYGLSEGERVS